MGQNEPSAAGSGSLLHYLSEGQLAERLGIDRKQLRALRQVIDQAGTVPEHLKREPDLQFLTAAQVGERLDLSLGS